MYVIQLNLIIILYANCIVFLFLILCIPLYNNNKILPIISHSQTIYFNFFVHKHTHREA